MPLYRGLPYGRLADFAVLDTRQYRTPQPCGNRLGPLCPGAFDPAATILGERQRRWLFDRLDQSPARWHGGPTGVFVRSFTGTAGTYPIAAFAARGYAVLRANPRGSSGYGKEFRYANKGDWGGGDYRDLMSGVDRVVAMGVADPDRLGVMGWSYGGFMTSWIVTQTKRFKAASAGAAVTNLMAYAEAEKALATREVLRQ